MKDWLTKEQKDEFWLGIREQHEKMYASALRSGALSDGLYDKHSIALMKMVMIILADNMHPLTNDMKKELKNLRHYI